MEGGARKGYCSKASLRTDAVPSSKVRIAMTIATIGRRMKKCAMGLSSPSGAWRGRPRAAPAGPRPWRRGRSGLALHARPPLLDALHDDPLAGLEPARHDDEVPDTLVQGHGPQGDLIVRPHHEDRLRSLNLLDSLLRHEDRVRPFLDD